MLATAIKRVGILRGGDIEHYSSSLKKGGDIISYIFEQLSHKYKPMDILIDKDYIWHLNGLPINPGDLMNKVEVVWNTSHPSFSNILESLSIPYVGHSSFLGTLGNNREMLGKHIKTLGLQMPRSITSPKSAREVFEKFSAPWIVKKGNEVRIVKTFNELAEVINDEENLTVEEFIAGKVASIHSVPHFRGQEFYTFPLGSSFGNFSTEEKEKLISLAKDLHHHLDARFYLKSDFVLNPRGKVYLLSVESMPDLQPGSHFSQVALSVGAEAHHIIEHILEQAF